MKHLLVPIAVVCAVLFNTPRADAKTYGGFTPGQTFTFTVKEKVSMQQVDLNPSTSVPVPAGIVNLNVGQKVVFTIGAKGQLKFKSSSFPFDSGGKRYNTYLVPPSGGLSKSGTVYKNAKGKPVGVSLNFIKIVVAGTSRTVTTVDYQLK